jgi:hypothetical protein
MLTIKMPQGLKADGYAGFTRAWKARASTVVRIFRVSAGYEAKMWI